MRAVTLVDLGFEPGVRENKRAGRASATAGNGKRDDAARTDSTHGDADGRVAAPTHCGGGDNGGQAGHGDGDDDDEPIPLPAVSSQAFDKVGPQSMCMCAYMAYIVVCMRGCLSTTSFVLRWYALGFALS